MPNPRVTGVTLSQNLIRKPVEPAFVRIHSSGLLAEKKETGEKNEEGRREKDRESNLYMKQIKSL